MHSLVLGFARASYRLSASATTRVLFCLSRLAPFRQGGKRAVPTLPKPYDFANEGVHAAALSFT